MKILAIETSCDETSIAIIESKKTGKTAKISVLSHITLSQIDIHREWGGVVPNLAKREHQKALVPILLKALKEAGIRNKPARNASQSMAGGELGKKQTKDVPNSKFIILNSILDREAELLRQFQKNIMPLSSPKIDLIAVTQGPGLEPALWVGVNFARALSYWWGIPLLGMNHMEGHIVSALFEEQKEISKQRATSYRLQAITYPALALLVSGGHTELVLIKKPLTYKIIGETLDDSAGEAFDKVAKMVKLPYPGGPEISREANLETGRPSKEVCPLPRPMINSKDYNFSFSGLKTAVLYLIKRLESEGKNIKKLRPLIAKEFQNAVVEVLVKKTLRAVKEYTIKTVILGGGVAANKELRKKLEEAITKELPNTSLFLPNPRFTGDNALMIAEAAFVQTLQKKSKHKKSLWRTLVPEANMRLL